LPFPDGAFDQVTSVFGIIFAPDHHRAAAEALRATRPGGTIGITAWPPNDVTAQQFRIVRSHLSPLPPGAPDPLDWGVRDHVGELFAPAETTIEVRERMLTLRYRSWDNWRSSSEAHGLSVVAKASMPPERYGAMAAQIKALIEQVNYGQDDAVVYDARYLEILVTTPPPRKL
ncbi:MAG: class I SAM-dependent methyltransferase, partial [Actinobacteria bacterium]|nr:class I SAM-dependent methyltransferase [Actinomycetota bacterium]